MKAAELDQKNRQALWKIADMYQNGVGVEKDEEKAKEYYEKANALPALASAAIPKDDKRDESSIREEEEFADDESKDDE